jgi:hypothetical protein
MRVYLPPSRSISMNFDPPHIHLLLNHIPVFASIGAALLVLIGLLWRSEDVLRVGLVLSVLVAPMSFGVKLTGEPAEHFVAGETGIERRRVHEHEEASELATYLGMATAVPALVALLSMRRRRGAARAMSVLTVVVAAVTFGLMARAASLGGEIRHPEVRAGYVPPPAPVRSGPPGDRGG